MRFFAVAAPVLLASFAVASPVASTQSNSVAERDVKLPIDVVGLLNGLESTVSAQVDKVKQSTGDIDQVTGALSTVVDEVDSIVAQLVNVGANVEPTANGLVSGLLGNGGLLGGLLGSGGLLGGLLGGVSKRDLPIVGSIVKDVPVVGSVVDKVTDAIPIDTIVGALEPVLETIESLVSALPISALLNSKVTGLLSKQRTGVASLTSGLEDLVPGSLSSVTGLLGKVLSLLQL